MPQPEPEKKPERPSWHSRGSHSIGRVAFIGDVVTEAEESFLIHEAVFGGACSITLVIMACGDWVFATSLL